MRRHQAIIFVLSTFFVPAAEASDVSWIFHPGYYTHSPVTGERVAQYEPEKPSIVPTDPTYQESGYRHQVIQLGTDNLNIVQTWGAGTAIRPYGEWERPYRPGATPYGPWYYPPGARTSPSPMWRIPYGPNGQTYGYGANPYGASPYGAGPMGGYWQPGPSAMPYPGPMPNPGVMPATPTAGPAAPRGQEL